MKIASAFVLISFATLACHGQQFSQAHDISGGLAPNLQTQLADVNDDGRIDLALASHRNGKLVWIGDDPITGLTEQNIIASGSVDLNNFKMVDIDDDGDLDAVVADYQKLAFWENDGTGDFTQVSQEIPMEHYVQGLNAADLNGDGHHDLIYNAWPSSLQVAFGSGQGDFSSNLLIHDDDQNIYDIELVDLEMDNDIDIVFLYPGGVRLIENLGNGNFGSAITIDDHSNSADDLFVGDMDGDGDLDVIYSGVVTRWYEYLSAGQFETHYTNSLMSDIAQLADVDADGDIDLLFNVGSSLRAGLNDGSGDDFELAFQDIGIGDFRDPVMADFNADGLLDLVTFSTSIGNGLHLHGTGQTFEFEDPQEILRPVSSFHSPTIADLDGDGSADIIAPASDLLNWYPNSGNWNFDQYHQVSPQIGGFSSSAAADFDSNGTIDFVAVSHVSGEMSIHINNGLSTFPLQFAFSIDDPITKVLSGEDFDNDGDPDIMMYSSESNKLKWMENEGDYVFTEHLISDQFEFLVRHQVVDFDSDGDLDLVFSGGQQTSIMWIENDGSGGFGPLTEIDFSNTRFKVVDFDSDGDMDLVRAINQGIYSADLGRIELLENDGQQNFTTSTLYEIQERHIGQLEVKDFSGNGRPDIVWFQGTTWEGHDRILWSEQSSDGELGLPMEIAQGPLNFPGLLGTDLDNDSDFDLVLYSGSGRMIWAFENLSISSDLQEPDSYEMRLMPNPIAELSILDVGGHIGPFDLILLDIQGRVIRNERNSSESRFVKIEKGSLTRGRYILQIRGENTARSIPFIIE